MQVKVVGFTSPFNWSKGDRKGQGMRVNVLRVPFSYENNVTGLVADSIYLDSSMFNLIPDGSFVLNTDYIFDYSSDGRRSYLSAISVVK